jgi:outer membrane protein assembly factor BamD (BamD/ComL family)
MYYNNHAHIRTIVRFKFVITRYLYLSAVVALGLLLPGCGSQKAPRKQKANPKIHVAKVKRVNKIKKVKKTSEIARVHTSVKDMTVTEAIQEKQRVNEVGGDYPRVIALCNRILKLSHNPEQVKAVRLERAKAYEANGNTQRAQDSFLEFKTLYPGSELAKFAHFKAIELGAQLSSDSSCDQTETKEAINLAHEFLRTYNNDTKYTKQIKQLIKECNSRLLDCELGVCGFYLHTYHYSHKPEALTAAKGRLTKIKKQFKSKIQNLDNHLKPVEDRIKILESSGGKKDLPKHKKSHPINAETSKKQKNYADRF